ncbi:hypothetical protein EBB59_03700 [Lysobacter pythonis]|uniref:Uncharacterized protein n=1 Tax=Solilutibacter pythonis TaxID=2483112 RepID=A0A3M2I0R6_9GAMM|nr:hypothetical protein [Lysobacter pythonis]RMH93763.1 hypothetical protein EBB59_03700 [Lysobacter pythonis]
MSPRALAMLLTTAMCFGVAPSVSLADSRGEVAAQADGLLRAASDDSLERLFASVHALSRHPDDAARVCRALASVSRASADTWLRLARTLSDDNRRALASALGEVAMSGWQSAPRPFDEPRARQWLRQAGVRAAMLNDGFVAGLSGAEGDTGQEALRCRSLGWLLDALATQPREARAAVTRLLLRDGLASVLNVAGSASRAAARVRCDARVHGTRCDDSWHVDADGARFAGSSGNQDQAPLISFGWRVRVSANMPIDKSPFQTTDASIEP